MSSGRAAFPIEVIEQITYLLFMKGLDEAELREERKAQRFDEARIGSSYRRLNDPKGRPYSDLRWSKFKEKEPRKMFEIVSERVFPFLREMAEDGTSHAEHGRRPLHHPDAVATPQGR